MAQVSQEFAVAIFNLLFCKDAARLQAGPMEENNMKTRAKVFPFRQCSAPLPGSGANLFARSFPEGVAAKTGQGACIPGSRKEFESYFVCFGRPD